MGKNFSIGKNNYNYSVHNSNKGYLSKLKQGFYNLRQITKEIGLPVALGCALLYIAAGFSGCNLVPEQNPSEDPSTYEQTEEEEENNEEPVEEKRDRILVFLNTSHQRYHPKEYEKTHRQIQYWIRTLTSEDVGYDVNDIYVLGHDSYNINFENYQPLTRDNLNNLMKEIDEKYSNDAFLILNSMGHAGSVDTDSDGEEDAFYTMFLGEERFTERYYSYEYPDLVDLFLEDDRQVLLNIHKCYAGFIKDAFIENPKDNVLVLASSKKDEITRYATFIGSIAKFVGDAVRIESSYSYFNFDGMITGEELFTYTYNRVTGVYSSINEEDRIKKGTPQMWISDNTNINEFIVHRYEK